MPFAPPSPRMRKWSLASTEVVGKYRVFDVLHHHVVDADERPRKDVYCFSCPDWCNVVALTEKDELVLIWQYRFGTDALSLEIPGGVIEPGESPRDAAERELREETGYEASSFEHLMTVDPNPALQGNRCHTFLARGARLAGSTAFDELEECELALIPSAHATDLLDGGHITHSLVIMALERFLRRSR